MKTLLSGIVILLATSTSMAMGSYRCPITSGDLSGADTVTLVESGEKQLNLTITGGNQKLVSTVVNYDWQNSNEQVLMFKSADHKTLVYVEKDQVGLKATVSAMKYIVRTNYCQQTGW